MKIQMSRKMTKTMDLLADFRRFREYAAIDSSKIQKKVPEMTFLEKKKIIVKRLEDSLSNLKKLKPEFFSPFDNSKNLVGESHSKLLQIFYLDRENEDLLVKLNQPLDRQSFNRFSVGPDEIDQIHKRK